MRCCWSRRHWLTLCVRAFLPSVLGFIPLIAWELFSLIYYGFLLPNTAYAKLNTGLPQHAWPNAECTT